MYFINKKDFYFLCSVVSQVGFYDLEISIFYE